MASEIHMPAPECLIENINGRLVFNPVTAKILSAIRQPVVVVAIVGLCRTGKSYLMNKLAGKNKGFSLGSTEQSHTKGIWMWCMPHPEKPDHALVLLDTEGLGDVEKGDNQNDSWIFALAVLLSSTFVYNSIGTINQQAMDQLHYVTELTRRIRAKSLPEKHEVQDSVNFVSFFPDFVWTLRDFLLDLEADGQPITADEYLEKSLKLKRGNDKKTKTFNETRLCIRKFFPEKKCFIFDRPAHRKHLIHLEQLQEEDLNPEFREQVADFCCYILSHSKAKTLSGGITVNGPRLQSLVQTYVNAISSGDLPCMENAVLALAKTENLAAVQKAIAHYDQQMGQKLKLPTETLQELLDLHRATEKEAIEVFMKNSFKDVDQVFQKKLVDELEAKRHDFCRQNMKASSDYCMALIDDIFHPLYEDVEQGTFSKPGGYYLFIKKMNELKEKYHQVPRKGVQTEETLRKYLGSKEGVADALRQTDQSLTEKEETEVERIKSEAAEAAKKMLEEMQKKYQQMMQEKEASYQEHMKQLTEKMEKERAQLIADQERVLALKLQDELEAKRHDFCRQNMKASSDYCMALIDDIFHPLYEDVEQGTFSKPGGYYLFIKKMNEPKDKYHQVPRKGVQTEETLRKYLGSKEGVADALRQTDQSLTEKEEETEVERIKSEAAEAAKKMLEEMQKKYQQMMQEKEASYQEHMKQLTEKMEKERAQLIADQERVLALKLQDELEAKRHDFCRQNMKASSDYCMALIDDIFHPLYEDVEQGTFSKPGGYYLFIKKMNEPKDKYHQVPRKGVQTEETLRKYLGSKEGVADALRQTDQSLTEKEEETEVERIKSEAAEAAKKMLEEMQKKYQQMMQEKEASYQEHMKQLTEKMEKERAQLIADQERVLALKLQDELEAKRHDFCRQNMKASSDYCMALIDDIFHPLYEDVEQGTFSKPGGYYLFIKKMNEPKDKYHQVPRKGVQTEETLRKYLGSKEGVADALRQTDQSLTEKEEETEVERIKSEAAEAAKKMLEEMQKKYQQMMQEKEASYQEHMKQLTEKMEKERAQLIADQERVLALKLQDELEAKRHDFCRQNMKASSDYCMALIDDIFHPLYEDVEQGTFSKPGGYYLFIKKMNEPKDKYHQVPRKGVQTEETLRKYLDSKEGVADALLQTDQSLTEKEKEIEVERMKSEAAEAANKMLEEMQKKNQQMMQEKEASYQEHMKQLTEKMENERAQLIADQERVLALKLQEQGRLLQEGFQKESMKLHEEIIALQKKQGESPPCNIL